MPADPFAGALKQASRQLRRMPADLRKRTGAHVHDQVAVPLAAQVRQTYTGPWSQVLAQGTRTRKGADPAISVGGARRVLRGGGSVRDVVYGDQFGGGRSPRTRQFARRGSRTVFRTFRREGERVFQRWVQVLDPFLDEWGHGGS